MRQRGSMWTVGAVALALLAVLLPGVGSAGPTPSTCNPKGSKTLLENREARVYTVPSGSKYFPDDATEACHFATGKTIELADGNFDFAVRPPGMRLDGALLAYAQEFDTDPNEGENQVWLALVDLRRTDLRGEHAIARRPAWFKGYEHVVKVGSVQFARGGALAWIVCPVDDSGFNAVGADSTDLRPNCIRAGDDDSVLLAGSDPRSKTRRVAHGRGISPGSLRRSGDRVTWIQNGRRRSAPLPD